MLRGLYAAASAMVAQLARQDVYANNLANANSVGFRRSRVALGQFPADLQAALDTAGPAAGGAAAAATDLDTTQGPLTTTSRPLDLALTGDAFFTIQTPNGPAYTRDGRFMLDSRSRLVTLQGQFVLGEQGPITLPATDFTVSAEGEISSGGSVVGKLRLVAPVNARQIGGGLFTAAQAGPAQAFSVSQGMVEQANVNGVQEMARMLNGYRLYEANATALRTQDETVSSLQRVVQ